MIGSAGRSAGRPRRLTTPAVALAVVTLVAACGGSSAAARAADAFGEYRATEEERSAAEEDFNRAYGEIAAAAGARDRERLGAAVRDARAAAAKIHRSLDAEIDAAADLVAYDATREDGRRLQRALDRSRQGLALFEQQLDIADRDPFLDRRANAAEVRRLSRDAAVLSVAGALERRRVSRALARTLGVAPPFDALLDRAESRSES